MDDNTSPIVTSPPVVEISTPEYIDYFRVDGPYIRKRDNVQIIFLRTDKSVEVNVDTGEIIENNTSMVLPYNEELYNKLQLVLKEKGRIRRPLKKK